MGDRESVSLAPCSTTTGGLLHGVSAVRALSTIDDEKTADDADGEEDDGGHDAERDA